MMRKLKLNRFLLAEALAILVSLHLLGVRQHIHALRPQDLKYIAAKDFEIMANLKRLTDLQLVEGKQEPLSGSFWASANE